jgi:tripartite-type tricarboxylate transporter receptor subunit TctC
VGRAHLLPSLRKNLPFDTLKDLSGVSLLATSPVVILAAPNLPANDLKELIALAKKDPGKLTYASPGSGSSMHLGGELLKTTAGIDMLHAPYEGSGGAYPDVFTGRVDLLIDPLTGVMVEGVFGAVVASGTPRDIVRKLGADMAEALQSAEIKARMADIGLAPIGTTPEQFDAFIRAEIDK